MNREVSTGCSARSASTARDLSHPDEVLPIHCRCAIELRGSAGAFIGSGTSNGHETKTETKTDEVARRMSHAAPQAAAELLFRYRVTDSTYGAPTEAELGDGGGRGRGGGKRRQKR